MASKKTPLNETCLDLGARMVEFAGWQMPIQFTGLIHEHNAVRNNSGIFDISHMGVFVIKGINPKDSLQKLVPSDLYRISKGEACYTVLLNQEGGIIDDLIIYDLGEDSKKNHCLLIVINAGCTKEDITWLKNNLTPNNIEISDAKKDGLLIALQGPEAIYQLTKVLEISLADIPRFGHRTMSIQLNIDAKPCSMFIARTGYTGEDGFEILLEKESGILLWNRLIENGVTPCGLGARDTLRLEAAMPLYGNDINQKTTPLEAGLGWLVHMENPKDFIGKEALEKQSREGIKKKLIALKLESKAIARKGYKVIYDNKIAGEITSGSWSPTLQKGIALAYLPKEISSIGTEIHIEIRNKLYKGTVVKKPFYRRVS